MIKKLIESGIEKNHTHSYWIWDFNEGGNCPNSEDCGPSY